VNLTQSKLQGTMWSSFTCCPFYRVPEHSNFMAQNACIHRDIPWQL